MSWLLNPRCCIAAVSKAKDFGTGGNTAVTHTRLYRLSLLNPSPTYTVQNSYVDVSGTSRSPKLTCGRAANGTCSPCNDTTLASACSGVCVEQTMFSTVVRDQADPCAFHCEATYADR